MAASTTPFKTPLSTKEDSASKSSILLTWINVIFLCYFITCLIMTLHLTEALPLQQVHHHMTVDELQNVFQVNSHQEVPNYEVVHIRSLHKRDNSNGGSATKEIHLSAFGKDFKLRLQRNDHLSKSADRLKMFMAEMHTDGNLNLTEVKFPGNSSDIGEVYQDDVSGAAVLLHHAQDGTLLLDGTIGSSLAIKPVPSRIRTELHHPMSPFPDDEMFLDNELPPKMETEKAHKETAPKEKPIATTSTTTTLSTIAAKGMHIVYQRKQQVENSTFSDYMFMEPDRIPLPASGNNRSKRSVRARREAPEAVWPEILVIVDYDTYNMHGGNNMDIKRYFISFWNGVDLRYKLLGGPKVRISLAGIIISKGRDATPYLENNRVGGNAVDSAGALTELGKYLFRERRLPTYDIAVVVTKLDICRRRKSGLCRRGTAGFAYVGGACVVNKRLEKVNSVAIIEDTGGFSGIIVAAHEVGHLLGAVHDGSPPPSYLGGPGAEHCRWEDGYIMSDLRHTERGFKWSICSTQQFKHFLNGDTAKCLYNIPHEDDELPRLLPGKLLSLDAQCRKDRGTSACFKDDRVCAQLFCFDSRSGYCVSYRPAAEGSPCGDGQFCINGQCIAEDENVIPDYSRVSEVIVPKPNDLHLPTNPNPAIAKGTHGEESDQSSGFKRTAILDEEDQVSIVNESDPEEPQPPPPIKRTSELDRDDVDSPEGQQRAHFPSVQVPPPLKRTSVLDDVSLDDLSGPTKDDRSDQAARVEPLRRTSRLDESGDLPSHGYPPPELHLTDPEVAHIRRTSHLDELDKFPFAEDGRPTTSRNLPNAVTKTGEIQSFDKVEDSDLVSTTGCRDIMRELAGGLTCKQFLRRFGDRYCNHHYIIANCCASRKLICEV